MKKWLFLFAILIFQSCSTKVISYISSESKFEQFESFRVVSLKLEGRQVVPENEQLFDDIKSQIINQMKLRGYSQSNIAPDLTLRYELNSSRRSESPNNLNNFNDPFSYSNFNISSRTIHESILILELFDAKKKLVWQGSFDLKQEKKEQKASKALQNAIGQIFTTYPYKAGSKEIHQELISTKKKKND